MLNTGAESSAFDMVAHVIQVALTPIFLLTGIAGLLSVFSTRHSYVTQHVDMILETIDKGEKVDPGHLHTQFRNLQRRSIILDVAVVFGILGGVATCAAAMLLFLGELDDSRTGTMMFGIFGAALVFTMIALVAFAFEMMLAGKSIRLRMGTAEDALRSGNRAEERTL
jgi:hypothetical protein